MILRLVQPLELSETQAMLPAGFVFRRLGSVREHVRDLQERGCLGERRAYQLTFARPNRVQDRQ
jgi:hypothetical protein